MLKCHDDYDEYGIMVHYLAQSALQIYTCPAQIRRNNWFQAHFQKSIGETDSNTKQYQEGCFLLIIDYMVQMYMLRILTSSLNPRGKIENETLLQYLLPRTHQ